MADTAGGPAAGSSSPEPRLIGIGLGYGRQLCWCHGWGGAKEHRGSDCANKRPLRPAATLKQFARNRTDALPSWRVAPITGTGPSRLAIWFPSASDCSQPTMITRLARMPVWILVLILLPGGWAAVRTEARRIER